ncbi:MAG: hypothetical protein ACT4NP_00725 [Pseudonocardiales bacterium]
MDVGTLVGISGPLAVFAAIAGFLLKAYLEKRKGDQEDRKVDRESESGIVETTKKTLRIVRDQMVQMSTEMQVLRSQVAELESQLRAKDTELQGLRSQLAALESQPSAKGEDTRLQPKRRASTPSQRLSPPGAAKDPPRSGPSQ